MVLDGNADSIYVVGGCGVGGDVCGGVWRELRVEGRSGGEFVIARS
jgi:hypothetical protein